MTLKDLNIDASWTLFLDRDGVLNKKRENDYVRSWESFDILPGVLDALKIVKNYFGVIVVVTNQQGVGKGLYSAKDLENMHDRFLSIVKASGGRIDRFYYSPFLKAENSDCRKPNTGMAFQAKKDFPKIDFQKSIMVGDSSSDMEMGRKLGMKTVFIDSQHQHRPVLLANIDFLFPDLISMTETIRE